MSRRGTITAYPIALCLLPVASILASHTWAAEDDPPEVKIGERLFRETRFAQYYFATPAKADPALKYTITMDAPLPGPYAHSTISCRACHMVDEFNSEQPPRMRSYTDFAHTSPVTQRSDGQAFSARNSMALVNIMQHGEDSLFHFDGEFNSMQDLVRATLTGRNFGWLADETVQATRHIAQVIRRDDGTGELARDFGGRYARVLAGRDPKLPEALRLPKSYRIDVNKASDRQILDVAARLISAYVQSLSFAQDAQGRYSGSPYDRFLILNDLPRQPRHDETDRQYSLRLLAALNKLKQPKWIKAGATTFKTHKQEFAFGQTELAGLKRFFNMQNGANCIACHPAPHFSDFSFHNTGLSQFSYDREHGFGEFNKLVIPSLKQRNAQAERYLPKTVRHPNAPEPFRQLVDIDHPGRTDLGLWNVFANPAMPAPQDKLRKHLCRQARQHNIQDCKDEVLLSLSLASFKTPLLRDLGHSEPYMHNGEFARLEEAVAFYLTSSVLAQQGKLRNAAPELKTMRLQPADFAPLVAFLRSLNEDYD